MIQFLPMIAVAAAVNPVRLAPRTYSEHGNQSKAVFCVMTTEHEIEIRVKDQPVLLKLDYDNWLWDSETELPLEVFPVAARIEGKRYLFYSDRSFGEAEK
jgi:hypothetical protein